MQHSSSAAPSDGSLPSDGSTAPDGAAPAAEARIIGVLNGGINGVPAFLRAALRAPPPEWTRGLLLPGLPCAPAVPMPADFELEGPFDEEEDEEDDAFAADAAACLLYTSDAADE